MTTTNKVPMSHTLKAIADAAAAAIAALSLVQLLPTIAAVISIAWYSYQFINEWKRKRALKVA